MKYLNFLMNDDELRKQTAQ